MFFPLKGRSRRRFTVARVEAEWARVEREDGTTTRLALDRLLAVDVEGVGLHHRFHGWRPRPRGYRTELRVLAVSTETSRCALLLPEWDPATRVEVPLDLLPADLRTSGAAGTCRANLASPSAAALNIHSCARGKIRGASRHRSGPHPDIIAEGQRFKRRSDGATFRVLGADPDVRTVRAWNGRRVVRIAAERLLALRADGTGRLYEYCGGGSAALRRERAESQTRWWR